MRGGRLPSWPVKQLLSPQRVRRRVQGLDRHRQRESRSGDSCGKELHRDDRTEPGASTCVCWSRTCPHPHGVFHSQALRRDTGRGAGAYAAERGWRGLWERGQSKPGGPQRGLGPTVS